MINQTRGMGIISHAFHQCGPSQGDLNTHPQGSLVSVDTGETTAYASTPSSTTRQVFHRCPGHQIYVGMVIGKNAREREPSGAPPTSSKNWSTCAPLATAKESSSSHRFN
ncbi:MAG: hypothetical protein M2R45_03781 [Verrucomicrobia subdivision 3 bacterium]|nr:hypothetical protein [Limisphaerales bacterium]MCS1416778.1 hypothetical protein [Limisphaerales bacterium]